MTRMASCADPGSSLGSPVTRVAEPEPGPPPSAGRGARRQGLLRAWDFRLLWSGQLISQVGDSLNKVALLWFVYELTGSALKATTVGFLQTVPPLVFGPLIGVYLDRLPKRAVMVWTDLLRTIAVMLIPILYGLGELSLERLYLLVFVISVLSTAYGPALSSAVPLLVPPSRLVEANALIQSTTNIGMLLGPAVSGVGIAFIGAPNALYVDAATFLISALCVSGIRLRDPRVGAQDLPPGRMLQDLMVGLRFVFVQHRTIVLLTLAAALYNLGASALVFLLPLVAKQLLQLGPLKLGLLWSGLGLGMLLASVGLAWARQGDFRERLTLVARATAVGGLAVCGLPWLRTPLGATALLVVIGGSTAFFVPVVWAVLQEMTPAPLLGRVFTTFSTSGMAAAMAGMLGFGWIADAIGPAASLVGIGATLLVTAAVMVGFREIEALDGAAAGPHG
jgi:MFS family permease